VSHERATRPSAHKRPRGAAPIDGAQRAIRKMLQVDPRSFPTEEIPVIPPEGTGVERPVPEWVEVSQSLYRCFAFVDVCGFTAYTDREGTRAATEVLTRFRSAVRDVAVRRGVRVTKWLGDGVMLVGTQPGPVTATVAELMLRFRSDPFEIHAGIAAGTVLLFEGDDYVGRPVNLAARLCEAAGEGEVLCLALDHELPDWVRVGGHVTVRALGIGDISGVSQLRVTDDAWSSSMMAPELHPAVG